MVKTRQKQNMSLALICFALSICTSQKHIKFNFLERKKNNGIIHNVVKLLIT